jgi:hypothetical protein
LPHDVFEAGHRQAKSFAVGVALRILGHADSPGQIRNQIAPSRF